MTDPADELALTIRVAGATVVATLTRTFGSLQAAANEAGLSRIFAGQHTRFDHEAGQLLGARVADFVLDHLATGLAKAG